jgi:hypothetical protein
MINGYDIGTERIAMDRKAWSDLSEKAKTHKGLQCYWKKKKKTGAKNISTVIKYVIFGMPLVLIAIYGIEYPGRFFTLSCKEKCPVLYSSDLN